MEKRIQEGGQDMKQMSVGQKTTMTMTTHIEQ